MKKSILLLSTALLVFSCKKNEFKTEVKNKDFVYCTVPNESKFVKNHPELGLNLRRNSIGSNLSMIPDTVVLFIDNGGTVIGPSEWYPTTFTAGAVSSTWMGYIVAKVIDDYSLFKVKVTTNVADYNAGNQYGKIRIVIGTGMTTYVGATGGISNIGSAWDGGNETGLVLTDNLANSLPAIAQSISHEAGHTFGLVHQSTWSSSACTLVNAYAQGLGTGVLRWQPIMGAAHINDSITTWHVGPTPYSSGGSFPNCAIIQDDFTVLASNLNVSADIDPAISNAPNNRTLSMNQTIEGVNNLQYNSTTHVYAAGNDNDYIFLDASARNGHIALTGATNCDYQIILWPYACCTAQTYCEDTLSMNVSSRAYTGIGAVQVKRKFWQSLYVPLTDMSSKWKLTVTP